jgi:inner membrane transporter RhtA
LLLLALRRIPANLFSGLMSFNLVFAALIGGVALGEAPGISEWVGVALIVAANTAAVVMRDAAAGRGAARPRVGAVEVAAPTPVPLAPQQPAMFLQYEHG